MMAIEIISAKRSLYRQDPEILFCPTRVRAREQFDDYIFCVIPIVPFPPPA